jgi:hypothetical protein
MRRREQGNKSLRYTQNKILSTQWACYTRMKEEEEENAEK